LEAESAFRVPTFRNYTLVNPQVGSPRDLGVRHKGNFVKKGAPFKGSQPKGDVGGNPKWACFNCNEMGHYFKDCPKSKSGNGGSKVITPIAKLAQAECNCLIFLKGKIFKHDVLCLLDTWAFHNFRTKKNAKKMELQLEELKAPIEVHFMCRTPTLAKCEGEAQHLEKSGVGVLRNS
jgi:hypothetical protein